MMKRKKIDHNRFKHKPSLKQADPKLDKLVKEWIRYLSGVGYDGEDSPIKPILEYGDPIDILWLEEAILHAIATNLKDMMMPTMPKEYERHPSIMKDLNSDKLWYEIAELWRDDIKLNLKNIKSIEDTIKSSLEREKGNESGN